MDSDPDPVNTKSESEDEEVDLECNNVGMKTRNSVQRSGSCSSGQKRRIVAYVGGIDLTG